MRAVFLPQRSFPGAMDAVVRWATKVAQAVMRGPPKNVYNPEYLTANNFFKRFNEVQRAEGFGLAYNKTRMESTLRKGTFVGMDYNGNKYYEDKNAPYGRTRWVEYPTPGGVWAIEQRYDGSMVSPEWHGWLHYTHDKPGTQLAKEFEKPFKQPHRVNQSMLRPEFGFDNGFHQPPGEMGSRVVRGRIGPKYESWSESMQTTNKELRNCTPPSPPPRPTRPLICPCPSFQLGGVAICSPSPLTPSHLHVHPAQTRTTRRRCTSRRFCAPSQFTRPISLRALLT